MGNTCHNEPQELHLPDAATVFNTELKVLNLDYGKSFYTPMEIYINGSQHKQYELSKIFLEKFQNAFEDFQEFDSPEEALGPFISDFKKGRFSPLFDETAGLEKKGKGQDRDWTLMNEQKFNQNWEKRFDTFKKSKSNKKKYDAFEAKKLKAWKENIRRYDFFMVKLLVEHIMGKSFQECLNNKINMEKYLNSLENEFNYQFLEENKKISILFFELSKLYPHIFFVQNSSKQLYFRLTKECNQNFALFKNEQNTPDQLIILNKNNFFGENFQQINVYQQSIRLLGERKKSNQGSQQESSINNLSEKDSKKQKQSGKEESEKAAEHKFEVQEQHIEKEIASKKPEKEKQQKQNKETEQEKLERLKRQAFIAVCSEKYLLISVNFSKEQDLMDEQKEYFEQLFEAMMKDQKMKYKDKIIIIGGSFQDQYFEAPEGMKKYPEDDEECTYFIQPLPVCYDIGDIMKADDDSEVKQNRHGIITNRVLKKNCQKITLIDGKSPAYKKESELNEDEDEQKRFESNEEEEDYEFSSKSRQFTRIPCDIHPFESYLIQVTIQKDVKIKEEGAQQVNQDLAENNSSNE